jgi:hypothetical protein
VVVQLGLLAWFMGSLPPKEVVKSNVNRMIVE